MEIYRNGVVRVFFSFEMVYQTSFVKIQSGGFSEADDKMLSTGGGGEQVLSFWIEGGGGDSQSRGSGRFEHKPK